VGGGELIPSTVKNARYSFLFIYHGNTHPCPIRAGKWEPWEDPKPMRSNPQAINANSPPFITLQVVVFSEIKVTQNQMCSI